jgi:hypothetical protein
MKCPNEPVLPPAQVFYFNGQALYYYVVVRLQGDVEGVSFFCRACNELVINMEVSLPLNNNPTKQYVLEGGASNQVRRIISQNFFFKSGINFIRQFFYETEF